MNNKTISALSCIGLVLTTVIWGFAFVVVKNSLDYIPPIYMLAFRFSIAAIALGLIFLPKLQLLNKTSLIQGIVLGFFLFAAYAVQTIGCKYTTAGKNAFLTTTYVIMIPFLGWIFTKKKPTVISVVSAVIALVGIGLLSLQDDLSINIGDILTIICGLFYAIHIIFISIYNVKTDAVLLTVLQLFFAAVFSWILAPLMDGGFPLEGLKMKGVVTSMLYLGLLSTMVAFLLQNVCQKYVKPATASLLLSFEAVFGALFSCIILHEVLSIRMFIGCFMILFAVILSETKFVFITDLFKKKVH